MKLRSYFLIAIALVLAALPAQAATYQTFVLSNEGANGLVTQLVNAGYGGEVLYDALVSVQLDTNPSVSPVLTDAFLNALAAAPASSQVITTKLSSLNVPGASYAISTDGTVQVVSIFGASYQGKSGISTLVSDVSASDTPSSCLARSRRSTQVATRATCSASRSAASRRSC